MLENKEKYEEIIEKGGKGKMKATINGKTYDTEKAWRIGCWKGDPMIEAAEGMPYEELYRTDDGEYFLYGPHGVESIKWELPDDALCAEYCGEKEILPIKSQYHMEKWAARFLPREEYEAQFGKISELKKIMRGMTDRELYGLFESAVCDRGCCSKESFCSDEAQSLKLLHNGCNIYALYEFCGRIWDLADPGDVNRIYPEEHDI